MSIGTLGWFFTICVFGALGWRIASQRRRRAGVIAFVVLLGVAIVGFYVGVSTTIFGAGGFRIFLNWAIVSACVGGFVGLLLRNRQLSRSESN